MDEETAHLYGTITAQGFIMQNLCAMLLAQDSDPIAAASRTGTEMVRQFSELPPTNKEAQPGVDDVIHHGEAYLRRFWENVEGRLRSMG